MEDFYPLSPMQQGLLFHTLYSPQAGVYVVQLSSALSGDLDADVFEQACRRVVERHAVFRTFFVWEGVETPIQIVEREVELPFERHDWRAHTPEEQRTLLAALLAADRARGFQLSKAPLMRVILIRRSETDYQLVWSHHHLLLDGWCLSTVLNEVFTFYEALRHGREPHLPPSLPYRDYIAWLHRQDLSKAELFWRQTLRGFNAPTPLISGRAGSSTNGGAPDFAEESLILSRETTAALQSMARRYQLTPGTIAQSAWAILLSRYSGERDVVFGTIVSGRPADLPGVESIIGLFINMLPVRVRVEEDARLLDWMKEFQLQQAEARQYEYSPLMEVQGWSEVPKGTPLFESTIAFENYPLNVAPEAGEGRRQAGSLAVKSLRSFERPHYPLSAMVMPGEELVLVIYYDRARFQSQTIERMLRHYANLLESIISNPDQRLSQLSLLDAGEQRQLLEEWNTTRTDYPQSCLHELFEAQAARTPDAIALIFEDQQLTYRQLNERSNQLAHYLLKQGVTTETLVGILCQRSPEMVIAVLGTLKAGGAYLPLDPAYPQQRLSFMLEDAGVKVLLTQEGLKQSMPEHSAEVVYLDKGWESISKESSENAGSKVHADNLAYVIYTSGSTGRPKGVLVTHRGIGNLAAAQIDAFAVEPASRVLQFAATSFDASVSEIAMALLSGATLCLAQQESMLPGPALKATMSEQSISVVTLPPTVLAALPADELPALRTLIVAGEACSGELVKIWSGKRRFINAYGPTEATVCATIGVCRGDEERPPIGRPMRNVEVYLLDQRLRPVPVGVEGEIYIGGVGLARGYKNRPELTAERFIPHFLSTEPGARLYRTGDVGRWLSGGEIEYLGRTDEQVKVRGFRIEPGEIEAVLASHEAVREAVAMVREDASGEKRLVAYVVAKRGQAATVSELRRHLRESLPDYMLPSAFVMMDELPLSPNGKVERRALSEPDGARPVLEDAFVEPRGEMEQRIARVWETVLGIERVGVHDNFFDLGGHSLQMIRVQDKLREELERKLSIVELFQYPTVGALARHLTQEAGPEKSVAKIFDRARKRQESMTRQNRISTTRKQTL
ncbi:MAG TPA: amino acid adenylation domain-containing protein [Pyrinomonadaceae bacterium]